MVDHRVVERIIKVNSLRNQSRSSPRPGVASVASPVGLIKGVKVFADHVSMDHIEGNIPGLSAVSIFDYSHLTLIVSLVPSLLASLPARRTTPPCWPSHQPCLGLDISSRLPFKHTGTKNKDEYSWACPFVLEGWQNALSAGSVWKRWPSFITIYHYLTCGPSLVESLPNITSRPLVLRRVLGVRGTALKVVSWKMSRGQQFVVTVVSLAVSPLPICLWGEWNTNTTKKYRNKTGRDE